MVLSGEALTQMPQRAPRRFPKLPSAAGLPPHVGDESARG
jgi:hypothetical protein